MTRFTQSDLVREVQAHAAADARGAGGGGLGRLLRWPRALRRGRADRRLRRERTFWLAIARTTR